VNPLVAVVLGWLLLHEPISERTVVAATVIIGGVVLIRAVKG
jgi:drug/metabolite transporter (DMT)-like permease